MFQRLVVIGSQAAEGVACERHKEKRYEGDEEGIIVELEKNAAFSDGKRSVGLVLGTQRLLVDFLPFVGILRFRGAALEQENGKDHVDAHLKELALPVLEDRFAKGARVKIGGEGNWRSSVLLLLFVEVQPARDGLSAKEHDEKSGERDGQAVVSPKGTRASCHC